MERLTPVVLAIGATHPLNVAGLGLDARVAGMLGVRVVTVVAGVSAQNATQVLARAAIDDTLIVAQFEALRGVPVGAVHIGALLDAQSVRTVTRCLSKIAAVPVVCDPVIAATGGDRLADDATVAALRDHLFARCSLITPNLDEAAMLLRVTIGDIDAMEAAAASLLSTGAQAVLVKGGHLAGDAVDVFVDRAHARRFRAPRIDATVRGTGDLLACAIAARLAHGNSMLESIEAARTFVRSCLSAGVDFAGTRTIP